MASPSPSPAMPSVIGRFEQVLYLISVAILVIGIVMFLTAVTFMAALVVAGDVINPWWVVLFLAFLLILLGLIMTWHFRSVLLMVHGTRTGMPVQGRETAPRMCINCGRTIPFFATFCPYCRHEFKAG